MAPVAWGIVPAKLDNLAAYLGLFTPKVVKCIDGGLASQMLMLAQGYHYSKERELPLYLDIDWFKRSGKDINGNRNRPFHLFDAFPEVRKKYSDKIVHRSKMFRFLFSDEETAAFGGGQLAPRSLYLKAYSHGISYLLQHLDAMRELFRFDLELSDEERESAKGIDISNSCALHIRKGDFVGSVHDVCTDKYYMEAICKMRNLVPDCTFYVFTNDEAYVRNMLNGVEGNFIYMTNRSESQPAVDMWLMQRCKHAIISNSGFSLVPAILSYSKDKEVILPSRWSNNEQGAETAKANQLPGWTVIDC